MFLNYIILSITASIDAIGIGISYGIRNIKIDFRAKLIISLILYISTFIGVTIGNIISLFLSNEILKLFGSIILIIIGVYIICKNRLDKKDDFSYKYKENFDMQRISFNEAVCLALSVSVDAFSMGIYASIENVNIILFPFCMMFIHVSFLFLGKFLGKYISDISKISESILKIFSGILLIFIGVIKKIF